MRWRTYPYEVSASLASEVQDAMHKVLQFIMERSNPYATDEVVKRSNFVSGELVEEKATKCTLAFVEDRKKRYKNFRKECFV